MNIEINSEEEICKLLSFVRVLAKGTFKFDLERMDNILEALSNLAKNNNLQITIINPSDEQVIAFTSAGIIAGAALGYAVASIPGIIPGAIFGGTVGFSLAHVHIRMTLPSTGTYGFMEII